MRPSDRRLIGTWRSDSRETFRHWLFRENVPEETRKKFKRIFGKLTHTYTPSRMIMTLRGDRRVYRYEVIGMDRSSVAIRYWERDPNDGQISHMHFSGSHYWIAASGQREFFRRVPKKALQATRAAQRNGKRRRRVVARAAEGRR